MYILIWFGFVLILLGIIVLVVFIAMYNTLIHLQMTCANTAQDLITLWIEKAAKITDPEIVTLLWICNKATTLEKQVTALNKLRTAIRNLPAETTEGKKCHTLEKNMQTEKRFFNNTARELTERLSTFPTKFIWSVFGLQAPKLLNLDEDAQAGILPEAKYL